MAIAVKIKRKRSTRPISQETYETIVHLVRGEFKIPTKHRTQLHRNAVVQYWRGKNRYSVVDTDDGPQLLFDGVPVQIKFLKEHSEIFCKRPKSLNRETYNTISDLVLGRFNIPKKDRSLIQKAAIVRYYRTGKEKWMVKQDGSRSKLFLCGEEIEIDMGVFFGSHQQISVKRETYDTLIDIVLGRLRKLPQRERSNLQKAAFVRFYRAGKERWTVKENEFGENQLYYDNVESVGHTKRHPSPTPTDNPAPHPRLGTRNIEDCVVFI
ncbi:hypothetical protein LOTGIDRAFT_164262 [Lottia gigantea]|uniref:Uncharacterized protein n=1 Tax=Lottia gigantea TaxID=225164 RepID=V3ZGM1_LOTGI|nr:hypothetical protein LOTGIDRAFT_164262 [Lottia gigantea]ESO90343.1 hypothetical protein LOTGIDRAFT_164262 [Lottia gigantea]